MITHDLDLVREGDVQAFSGLYDASYDTIYRFIYHRTLDTHLTEDIVSVVYMKAIKNIRSLEATSEGEFYSWILRIAYTTLVDTMRKVKPEDSLEEMIVEPGYERDISGDIDNRTKLEEVLSFMKTLSERDQAILSMRIWDELSYEQIAAITGQSVANCKQIVSRSLAKVAANVSYLFIFSILLSVLLSSHLSSTVSVIPAKAGIQS